MPVDGPENGDSPSALMHSQVFLKCVFLWNGIVTQKKYNSPLSTVNPQIPRCCGPRAFLLIVSDAKAVGHFGGLSVTTIVDDDDLEFFGDRLLSERSQDLT
jgi:hypothetical protein